MRIIWVIFSILLIFMLACEDDKITESPGQPGFNIEDIEIDNLNAYPIFGYIQTGGVLAPTIDGSAADDIWQLATSYQVETKEGKDGFSAIVNIKALYDNWYAYFLITWEDTSESSQTEDDGFAIMWNQNSADFISCANFCHAANSMSTDINEFADVWKWGALSTDSSGYLDDGFLDDEGFQDDTGLSINDIIAKGIYEDGIRILEMKRRLKTVVEPENSDVEFNPESNANVDFHLAVFNNSQGIEHAVSQKVHVLHFLQLIGIN